MITYEYRFKFLNPKKTVLGRKTIESLVEFCVAETLINHVFFKT